jgi:uncharacterized membrane protein
MHHRRRAPHPFPSEKESGNPSMSESSSASQAPPPVPPTTPVSGGSAWERLRWHGHDVPAKAPAGTAPNAQAEYEKTLSRLDRFAVRITEKIGSFGFFLIILAWTVSWCGYNVLASEVKTLHWKPFDPFPAFVAYLLISNVIQILLMPLIMIGQNLQARFADTRAQLDFDVNRIAEKEASANLRHMEHQTNLLLLLLKHSHIEIPEEELRQLEETLRQGEELARTDPVADAAQVAQGATR